MKKSNILFLILCIIIVLELTFIRNHTETWFSKIERQQEQIGNMLSSIENDIRRLGIKLVILKSHRLSPPGTEYHPVFTHSCSEPDSFTISSDSLLVCAR